MRLGNIVYNHGQTMPMGDFCYIDIGSIDNRQQRLNAKDNIIKASKAPSRARKIVEQGDILYSTVRPYLHNICIVDRAFSQMPIASTGFAVMACFQGLNNKFLFNFLLSPDFDNYVNNTKNAKGVAYPAINDARFYNTLVPLPPTVEQQRIVTRIEELLPHVASYGVAERKLTTLNRSFPDALKKSILQAAVQGKLVPQDPDDEPASLLLEHIRAEKKQFIKAGKIKSDNGENVIFRRDNSYYEKRGDIERCIDNEIPFEIPESWEWVRLETLCSFGDCENVESDEIAPDAWLLELEDIEKDGGRVIRRKRKLEVGSLSTKHRFVAGQVLYSKLRPYLNKVVVADEDGFCTSEILPLNFGVSVYNRYAQIYLMSSYFVDYATQCSYGVKMPRLGTSDGRNALVPLPPYVEQERIVSMVEELSKIVENIQRIE